MNVLVIIVTFNGRKWLDSCLSSVLNSSVDADLYIVDNGSTDGSIEYIKEKAPKAILVESKENLGFGKANNQGLRYALENGYDYVYLLNQDAWIEQDTLESLIEVSEKNPEYGILSPIQVNKQKNKLDLNFSYCCPSAILSDSLCKIPLKDVYETDFVMAAHWLITRKCLSLVGGFSPAFPHYGEDNNYIHRAQSKGLKVGIVPGTLAVHDRENRVTPLSKKRYMHYIANLIILNNPLQKNRIFQILKQEAIVLLKHPKELSLKFLIKSIKSIPSAKRFRELYSKRSIFLCRE